MNRFAYVGRVRSAAVLCEASETIVESRGASNIKIEEELGRVVMR